MRLILGGGGDENEEAAVLDHFARCVGDNARVLFLPIAASDSETHPGRYRDWIASALGSRGVTVAAMWPTLAGHAPSELEVFDAIFIGGGNTFDLLHQLRSRGFANALVSFASADRVVYGGSAGAIILGRDIASCIHYDQNRIGLTDTSGLDLCAGNCVWCHFEAEQSEVVDGYVKSTGHTMLVLPKTAGVVVTADGLASLGAGPVYFWSRAERSEVPPLSTC